MRRVIVSNLITLDGYIEGPGKDISWFGPGPEFFAYAQNLLAEEVDTLLFGRITYQMMESYWTRPDVERDDPQVARAMNELPKWVFSETLKQAPWGHWDNAKVSAYPTGTVRKLKAEKGKAIVIFGSGALVSTLTANGLIDEYRIMVAPVILGGGTPQFRGLSKRVALKLAGVKTFDQRLAMLTYHLEKK